jgi:hypothetical protein
MQRLGRLRKTDSADTRERIEQLPQGQPRHRVARSHQRRIGSNRPQRPLDFAAALQNCGDLAPRDARAVAVREPQIVLGERPRRRALVDVETLCL